MKADRVELHLKYRPKTFDELFGNEALKKSVLDVLDRTRTFLFYGPRGCGKTTLARLIAAQLGISDIDVSEIDAADATGVDNARAIKEAAQFSPLGGKYKIYIIDECHRLSGQASDSLLKTLEAPPDHCYFVFATTALNKVPTTIKSRSKCYEVKPFTDAQAGDFIKYICKKEGFRISPAIRQAIIDSFQEEHDFCIPREILVALDLVRNVEDENEARTLIHANVHHEVIELCRALLAQKPWGEIAIILKELKDEPESIRRAILGYMNSVLLNKKSQKDGELPAAIIKNFEQSYMYSGKAALSKDCFYTVAS
jgi:DNA polymerase III gamma/tau subunit